MGTNWSVGLKSSNSGISLINVDKFPSVLAQSIVPSVNALKDNAIVSHAVVDVPVSDMLTNGYLLIDMIWTMTPNKAGFYGASFKRPESTITSASTPMICGSWPNTGSTIAKTTMRGICVLRSNGTIIGNYGFYTYSQTSDSVRHFLDIDNLTTVQLVIWSRADTEPANFNLEAYSVELRKGT